MSQPTNVQQGTSASAAQKDDDFISHHGSWREALVIARHHARVAPPDVDERTYWDREIRVYDEAFGGYSPNSIPDDFRTHHSAWREALVIARDRADVQFPDVDDRAYWEHELAAYDRAFASIGIAPVTNAPVVSLADGYNGHTVRFDANPIEVDGESVKLRCAESGKEYMTAWRSADVLRDAIESQASARSASRDWIREVARNVLKGYAGVERVSNLYDSDQRFSGALLDLAGEDFEYPDFAHLSVADAVKKAARLGGPIPTLGTSPHQPVAILAPDFAAVRDKRKSELTPAQQEDSLEGWLRDQVGTMPEYHEKHYRFLLKRLDEVRQAAMAAVVPALDGSVASVIPSEKQNVKPIFEPHIEQFRGGLLRVHTSESHADFLIPEGVTDRKEHLMGAARLARIESQNLQQRANEMAERARCAEVAASLCEQLVAQPDQSPSLGM
ncbi:MAG: hypothetical protein VB131_03395 [Burkholderia gladioli]